MSIIILHLTHFISFARLGYVSDSLFQCSVLSRCWSLTPPLGCSERTTALWQLHLTLIPTPRYSSHYSFHQVCTLLWSKPTFKNDTKTWPSIFFTPQIQKNVTKKPTKFILTKPKHRPPSQQPPASGRGELAARPASCVTHPDGSPD